LIFVPGFLSLCLCLLANDTTATIVGGKITYTQTDDISIEEEELHISIHQIHVFYRFLNHAKKAITTHVAFPLPPSPLRLGEITIDDIPGWDESYYAYHYLSEGTNALHPAAKENLEYKAFINFKRTENGKEGVSNYRIQAIDRTGKDITTLLKNQNIPVSALYVSDFTSTPLPSQQPELQQKLRKLGLLAKNGYTVLWQVYTTYFWQQTFEPGKITAVTHSYRPRAGHHHIRGPAGTQDINKLEIIHRNYTPSGKPESMKILDFCPTKAQQECLLSWFNKGLLSGLNNLTEVRYILSTGGNWKGPIKKFKLRITPPHQSCLVLCCFPSALTKNKQGIYTAEIKNFKPTSELKVLFVSPTTSV
jgi:hypothetical protein